MTDHPAEPEGLTDEEISPDTGRSPLSDTGEASDPDIRNTTVDQENVEDEGDTPAAGAPGR